MFFNNSWKKAEEALRTHYFQGVFTSLGCESRYIPQYGPDMVMVTYLWLHPVNLLVLMK